MSDHAAKELGISERVSFLGMVRDVYAVMQHWDLFAYATTENEGLGNALIEAMSYGLPPVAYDCETGPEDIIDDDVNGLLVRPLGDEIALSAALLRLMILPMAIRARNPNRNRTPTPNPTTGAPCHARYDKT